MSTVAQMHQAQLLRATTYVGGRPDGLAAHTPYTVYCCAGAPGAAAAAVHVGGRAPRWPCSLTSKPSPSTAAQVHQAQLLWPSMWAGARRGARAA